MSKENGIKEFLRTTYRTGSPIPYFISIQIGVFVLIHIFDLLAEVNMIQFPLYDWALNNLRLPIQFSNFIKQPWSLFTYPFVYTGLLNIAFDCLWLYWMGNLFLSFLNRRQFLTVYLSSLLIGGLFYLALGNIEDLTKGPQSYLQTTSFGLATLISSLYILIPNLELQLFIFGRVRFKWIALVYLALQFSFFVFVNHAGAIIYMISMAWGILFMKQLQSGRDYSKIFIRSKKSKLRVIRPEEKALTYKSYKSDLPNQEIIDEILDKISQSGYESLSSREKEILFKASREEQE